MQLKLCSKCHIEKPYSEFYTAKKTKDGFRGHCKECEKQYKSDNADKLKQYAKQYTKQWRIDNPEYTKQYKIDNAEHIKQYGKEYRQTEHGRLNMLANVHRHRALLYGNTPDGKHFTPDDIRVKLKLQKSKCVYCQTSIKDCYEIDHIIPLTKCGSNMASNIQLLCEKCNGSSGKGSKLAHDFAKKHGMLI